MEDQKSTYSFSTIAVSFFVLIVFPLAVTGAVIVQGVIKVGQDATQANLRVLDEDQKQAIVGRTKNVAEAVAQFFVEREKDIRIASILPKDEEAYGTFLSSNTRGVVKSSQIGVVKVPVPIYRQIAFIDRNGREILKVNADGAVAGKDALRDVSDPQNGEYGYEDYFIKARSLQPGEVYLGPVVGLHVNRSGFEQGERFDGIMRMATPVFDLSGFAGVVALNLNFVHVMEFTDHIIPTEEGMVFSEVGIQDTNYSFMVDRDGFVISHPLDYFISGFGKDMQPIPVIDEQNYEAMMASGGAAMNMESMGFDDENLPAIHGMAGTGKSGSMTYQRGDTRLFVAYAPIPYYGSEYKRPQGFGWIGMVVDIDRYHNLSREKVEEIKENIARWQKSSIMVIIISLILLFMIALILSRGLYRQMIKPAPKTNPENFVEND